MNKYFGYFLGFILGIILLVYVIIPVEVGFPSFFHLHSNYITIATSVAEVFLLGCLCMILYHFVKSPIIGLTTQFGYISGYAYIVYSHGGFQQIFQTLPLILYIALGISFYFALSIGKKTGWYAIGINMIIIAMWNLVVVNLH